MKCFSTTRVSWQDSRRTFTSQKFNSEKAREATGTVFATSTGRDRHPFIFDARSDLPKSWQRLPEKLVLAGGAPLLLPEIIHYASVLYDDAIDVMPISLPPPTLLCAGCVRLNVCGSGFR